MKSFLKNLFYNTLKFFLSFGFAYTFRHIITSGYSKVKKNKPSLFVANHQNTFLDGFMMVYTAGNSNPHILVRADIFKAKLAQKALHLIKLMPIYRKRDGHNNMSQNEQIFNQCIRIFEDKDVVALFPEGNHAFPRKLRSLQKGAARIAFQAEEENQFKLNLSLVPLGLQYENQTDTWHDVHVHYDDALLVRSLEKDFHDDPHATYINLTNKIETRISSQMIDIKPEEDLLFYEQIRILMKEINQNKADHTKYLVHHENEMIQQLTSQFTEKTEAKKKIVDELNDFISSLKDKGIDTDYPISKRSVFKKALKFIGLLILLPFFLLFKIFTAIPQFIIEQKVIRKIKDNTWHLSIRFALAAFLYPIFYGLVWLILALFIDNLLAAMIICSIPLINIIGLEWTYYLREFKNDIRFSQDLANRRQSLINKVQSYLG